jgi:hypothetical protein
MVIPRLRSPETSVNLTVLAKNPEALRIVVESTDPSGDPAVANVFWFVQCWVNRPFRDVIRERDVVTEDVSTTIRLTARVPGGVRAWDVCYPQVDVFRASPGGLKVWIQARYP